MYLQNCSSCHGNLETGKGVPGDIQANNGLAVNYVDQGAGSITEEVVDMGMFKIPALRNIALTAPYMHDGRFESLNEVIEHYSSGIQNHPNLHFRLKDQSGNARTFQFNEEEKEALIVFLHTLTDEEFITAEKYADPFLQ